MKDLSEYLNESLVGLGLTLAGFYTIMSVIGYKVENDKSLKDILDNNESWKAITWLAKGWKDEYEQEKVKSVARTKKLEDIVKKYINDKKQDFEGAKEAIAKELSESDISLLNKIGRKLSK